MRSLRSMCEKECDHWSFAAKAIGSLFAVFKAWRCNIMYDDWRVQGYSGDLHSGKTNLSDQADRPWA